MKGTSSIHHATLVWTWGRKSVMWHERNANGFGASRAHQIAFVIDDFEQVAVWVIFG